MIWIKHHTKDAATIYLSKDESDLVEIGWVEESEAYYMRNKPEQYKMFCFLEETLGFDRFIYEILRLTEEERKMLDKMDITEPVEYTVFVQRNRKVDPYRILLNMIRKEEAAERAEKGIIDDDTDQSSFVRY